MALDAILRISEFHMVLIICVARFGINTLFLESDLGKYTIFEVNKTTESPRLLFIFGASHTVLTNFGARFQH